MAQMFADDGQPWRASARRLSDSRPNREAVHDRFRAVVESQESSQDNVIDIALLIAALNRTTL